MLTLKFSNKLGRFFVKIFFILTIFSLFGCDIFSNRILSQTVVSVGGSYKMTTQDLSRNLASKLKNLDALSAKDPQVIAQFKDKIVRDFIVDSMMLLWFEEKKLTLTSQETDAEIKKLVGNYPDDASFREALSEEGLTFSQWKDRVELGLKRKKIFEQITSQSAAPTDSELESYFQSNKSRFLIKEAVLVTHIQVADENQAEIVKKLSKTQKFSELIKKFSMSSDASFGGQYGWIEHDFNQELERLFKARLGEITGPLKLADGFHLFHVEQKRSARPKTFAEAKEQVKSEVLALRETARFSAWLDEQIKRYKVYKNNVILDSLYVETR